MPPDRLVVVAGTGTEVGKTWLGCRLVRGLAEGGLRACARKPAQSFGPGDDARGITDAQLLAEAAGDDPLAVCAPDRWYPLALAPPMAAEALGRPAFTIADLLNEVTASWPSDGCDVGVVETAGGLRSPLAADGDNVDLIAGLAGSVDRTEVVLVADAGLGTLSSIRLCVDALTTGRAGVPIPAPVVFLNRFDPGAPLDLHRRNAAWLRDVDGAHVAVRVDELISVMRSRIVP